MKKLATVGEKILCGPQRAMALETGLRSFVASLDRSADRFLRQNVGWHEHNSGTYVLPGGQKGEKIDPLKEGDTKTLDFKIKPKL